MKRNPNCWQQGRPFLDEVIVFFFGDQGSQVAALKAGLVDALLSVEGSSIGEIDADPDIVVSEATSSSYLSLAMDTRAAPFSDIRIRKAVQAVTDRQAIVDAALFGHGTVGYDVSIPPNDPHFSQAHLPPLLRPSARETTAGASWIP
jgi:peptide/nickel transport system substrate-binding protein